jgi:hypothetical protein
MTNFFRSNIFFSRTIWWQSNGLLVVNSCGTYRYNHKRELLGVVLLRVRFGRFAIALREQRALGAGGADSLPREIVCGGSGGGRLKQT